jgi:site-specific recombinase XerD
MVNRRNYLWAKAYLAYLSDLTQLRPKSVNRYWSFLKHLLIWADEVPLSHATDIRPSFPSYLTTVRPNGANSTLSHSTVVKAVRTAKRFFRWLKLNHRQEFRHLPLSWIEALRPPRVVSPTEDHEFVTLDDVLTLAALEISEANLTLRRDRAAAAMLYTSGMRASAFVSLPLEAVDLEIRAVKQWPSLGVRTKNLKTATTYLLNIPDLLAAIEEWDSFVRAHLSPMAMWYPPVISQWGDQTLSPNPPGAHRHINLARRMRKLCNVAGVPYKSPHKFRHGHAVYALQHAKTMADYKAVSMNLMHSDIRVTDRVYAPLTGNEVQQRITRLTDHTVPQPPADGDLATFIRGLSDAQLSQALVVVAERLVR